MNDQSFPRHLRWALVALYPVLILGILAFAFVRVFSPSTVVFNKYLWLALAIPALVQVGAVVKAIVLLVREPQYRYWVNILLTFAGALAVPYVLLACPLLMGLMRVHM